MVGEKRLERKKQMIEYKGGKCIRCGYNKCPDALDFHHRNPDEKEFSISRYGRSCSVVKWKKELDKCDLLCRNCHAELHFEDKWEVNIMTR